MNANNERMHFFTLQNKFYKRKENFFLMAEPN